MKDYKLEIGNSDAGPIGLVAYTSARSPEAALRKFQRELGDAIEVRSGRYYQNVYLNWSQITVKNIEEAD